MFRNVLIAGMLFGFALTTPLAAPFGNPLAASEAHLASAQGVTSTLAGSNGSTAEGRPAVDAPAHTQSLTSHGPTPRALAVESEYDAVRVPDDPALNPRSQITLELWIKRQRAGGCGSLISKGRGTGYWLGVCDGRLRFTAGGPGAESSLVLPEGRWTHVAATFDGATLRLYVNGVLDRTTQLGSDGLTATDRELVIGADAAPGAFFPGGIDHVRLWNVVRSEAEIRDNRLLGLSPQTGLVAQWPLDGNARDLAGGHDGRSGVGAFSYDGVVPRDITLPLSASVVTVDGRCDPVEYGSAERVALEGSEPLTAYVQISDSQVYVCVLDLIKPPSANAFLAVALDRNLSRDARAQPGDYRFLARYTGNAATEEGDGQGNWRALTLPAGT